MSFSPFDFDVVTGPALPREEPKEPPRPTGTPKPEEGALPPSPAPSK